MSIYTPDLEPQLYDQTEFLDIVKRFVLGRNFAKVRVVLGDGSRLLRDGNRFVAMGRRLTSYIDIRVVHDNRGAARQLLHHRRRPGDRPAHHAEGLGRHRRLQQPAHRPGRTSPNSTPSGSPTSLSPRLRTALR